MDCMVTIGLYAYCSVLGDRGVTDAPLGYPARGEPGGTVYTPLTASLPIMMDVTFNTL